MSHFGEHLREARKRAKLTQQALADKVAVDDSYISKMETEPDRAPIREVVLKLARALGLEEKTSGWRAFLLAAGVLSEEDVEGFALVEVEDGQALKSKPRAQKPPSASDVLAATGTFGAPSSLGDDQEQQIPPFEEQVRQTLTSFHLPYGKRRIAQQMILESIRIICWGLTEAED